MPKVIGTHWVESGTRFPDLARAQGIDLVEHGTINATAGFHGRHATLYSYVSPTWGREVWAIEVECFEPPDAQYWETTQLDAAPSLDAITAISRGRKVAIGDLVEGA